MSETHTILNGKVRIYKRESGKNWFCATFLEGKNRRVSTKEESLSRAKEFAEDWYFRLRNQQRDGILNNGPTFAQAAEKFLVEYQALTAGERHPMYVQGHRNRARNHLIPFFGDKPVTAITAGSPTSGTEHETANPRNSIKKWPITRGLYSSSSLL